MQQMKLFGRVALLAFCAGFHALGEATQAQESHEAHEAHEALEVMRLEHQMRQLGSKYYQKLEQVPAATQQRFLRSPQVHSGAVVDHAAQLIEVTPGSPAAKAGMQVGDRLLEIDDVMGGEDGDAVVRLQWAFRRLNPGDLTSVTFERDGERHTAQVEVLSHKDYQLLRGEGQVKETIVDEAQQLEFERLRQIKWRQRQGVRALMGADLLGKWDGLLLVSLASGLHAHLDGLEGVLVLVCEDADHPLKAGDIIMRVGKNPPKDAQHAVHLLYDYADEVSVPLAIQRLGQDFTINMHYPQSERFESP